jgi:hypothetical protein
MSESGVHYRPSPVLAEFHGSDAFVRGVMGPIGSGKSVACCWEIFTRAQEQAKGPTGKRKSRWAVVRNTYGELRSTTIKTWLDWFPEDRFGKIKLADSPITHELKFGDVELEVLFMSLDRPEDIKKLLSLEVSGMWLNEARELDKSALDGATSRVGRYPSARDGGCSWSGVIMDTNPPDDSHWWYRLAEEEQPEGWEFFRQPGGLIKTPTGYKPNRLAENVANLPGGYDYYLRQVPGKDENWIKAYLLAEYAAVLAGRPIYAGQWSDTLHVAPVSLIKQRDIILGWDFGLTPACVVLQVSPRGRVAVLEEFVGEDCGVRQFVEGLVKPALSTKYRGCPVVSVGDPAGKQRAQTDERAVFDELRSLGIPTSSVKTNAPQARWEAVRYFLGQLRDGSPVFSLDPSCKVLRKGFNGGYRFRQLQVSGEARYSETAEKNLYSHIHDALQYACLSVRGDLAWKESPKKPRDEDDDEDEKPKRKTIGGLYG